MAVAAGWVEVAMESAARAAVAAAVVAVGSEGPMDWAAAVVDTAV